MDKNSKTYKILGTIGSIPIMLFGGFLWGGIYEQNFIYILISLIFLAVGLTHAAIVYYAYMKE